MISSKNFNKKIWYYEPFDIIDFCDYCDDPDCPRTKKIRKVCFEIKEAKKGYKGKDYEEFQLEKNHSEQDPPHIESDVFWVNYFRTIAVCLGKPKFFFETDGVAIDYKRISTLAEFKHYFDYQDFGYKHFKVKKINCYYLRKWVYFAMKIIDKPEILVPYNINAPLVVRNEKLTIFISPKVEEDDD